MNRSYHDDGSQPPEGWIFVFGSNLAGAHGAGAAKQALKYGAKYGKGHGLFGNTYAIPTKDARIYTIPLSEIEIYVDGFVRYTHDESRWNKYFVTRVGCGLAGYSDHEMAPLFKNAINCSFANEWYQYLEG